MINEQDTREIIESKYINPDCYKNSTVMVTGATGLIGSQVVSALLSAGAKVIALVRNREKAEKIFAEYKSGINYLVQDILEPISTDLSPDFIIHTANSTSSKSFKEQPVETINSIIAGTRNVLEYSKNLKNLKGIVYLSSMEVYGQTDFDKVEPLKEEELGYIDISNPRNSYPEGKRLAECLCKSYAEEYKLPVKIARLTQIIGTGIDYNDNRVFAQFARSVAEGKDIVLHTKGETVRSYCYVTDLVSALLVILEKGENGECYNVANTDTACSIREMAEMLTEEYKTSKLVFELDNENNNFYLPKIKTVLDTAKLKSLGWSAKVDLKEMYSRLIVSMREINEQN